MVFVSLQMRLIIDFNSHNSSETSVPMTLIYDFIVCERWYNKLLFHLRISPFNLYKQRVICCVIICNKIKRSLSSMYIYVE